MDDIGAVNLVDKLMLYFRNNVRPSNEDLVKAYEAGINVVELKRYIEEVELEKHTACEEHEWDN